MVGGAPQGTTTGAWPEMHLSRNRKSLWVSNKYDVLRYYRMTQLPLVVHVPHFSGFWTDSGVKNVTGAAHVG